MLYSEDLLGRQNADGGWSYFRGGSWTEPTCYAILALAASGMGDSAEVRRGRDWLQRCQRLDGGSGFAYGCWARILPVTPLALTDGPGIPGLLRGSGLPPYRFSPCKNWRNAAAGRQTVRI